MIAKNSTKMRATIKPLIWIPTPSARTGSHSNSAFTAATPALTIPATIKLNVTRARLVTLPIQLLMEPRPTAPEHPRQTQISKTPTATCTQDLRLAHPLQLDSNPWICLKQIWLPTKI